MRVPMRLVIAEKPSVARDLARALGVRGKGDGWLGDDRLRITWCVGHLVELEDPSHYDERWKRWSTEHLPMVPEHFALRPRKNARDQFTVVKRLLRDKAVDDVVNACDAGREGELIFRYVYEAAGCNKPVLRLWVSSLTDDALTEGWKRLVPAQQFDRLGDAARCRSEADWLVGLNATRAMTLRGRAQGGDVLLSLGRVQTPTLALVVARDAEIEAFVPEPYFKVHAQIEAEGQEGPASWRGTWFVDDKDVDKDWQDRIRDPEQADAIARRCAGKAGTVRGASRRTRVEKPPLLYDLTSLQKRANQRYGLTAERTLQVAQALYETHKLITYPRTDARFLTEDLVPTLPDRVRSLQPLPPYAKFATQVLAAPLAITKRIVDDSEVGDHHAILPTGRAVDGSRLSPDEKRVFDLVARRLLAALMPDARFELAELVVEVPHEDAVDRFRAKGRVCLDRGWQAVDPPSKKAETELPRVAQDAPAQLGETEVEQGQTRPPRPYDDASLLTAMETAGKLLDDRELVRAMRGAGLGTPATRAAVLRTLLDRKFVVRRGKELRSTELGRALIGAVPPESGLASPEMTGRWEARLSEMADGKERRDAFMRDVTAHVHTVVDAISQAQLPESKALKGSVGEKVGACPCGGTVTEKKWAYQCDSCAWRLSKTVAKRAISGRMVATLLKSGRTQVVKGFRSKKGKAFSAGLERTEEGASFYFENDRPKRPSPSPAPPSPDLTCPRCGQGRVIRGRTAWGCGRWKEGCDFVLRLDTSSEVEVSRELAQLRNG